MFETHDQARLPPDLLIAPPAGTNRWAYVAQTWNHEWFFATHETVDEDGNSHRQQFMIPIAPYLLGFTSRNTPEAFISQIQLVSPPWLNESGTWLMEPIGEIRLVGQQFCYLTETGRFYPSELNNVPGKVVWSGTKNGDE